MTYLRMLTIAVMILLCWLLMIATLSSPEPQGENHELIQTMKAQYLTQGPEYGTVILVPIPTLTPES